MLLGTIIFIAIGLSMDAFSVCVSMGYSLTKNKIRHAFILALSFGTFQAFMPIIGWLMSHRYKNYIMFIDHWIAFFLLSIIGLKMIVESFSTKEKDNLNTSFLSINTILLLSIATSIDALAVGVTFGCLDILIIKPILIIGIITFVMCLVGYYVGHEIGHFFESKIEVIGGVILIIIGFKILLEHTIIN